MVTVINQNEIKKKKENKFSLPLVNKYICCFCMPLKSAIQLCTVLIAVFFAMRIIATFGSTTEYSSLLYIYMSFYAINIVTLLLFLLGTTKNKVILMKPLKYTFLLSLIPTAISAYNRIKLYFSNDPLKNIKLSEEDANDEEMIKQYTYIQKFSVLFEIIFFIFIIYYYYAIFSYIYTIEEDQREEKERRDIEENVQ